ncbi:MAG: glycosyl hydrolase family 8 [Fibromonadales bacterium]|nr:glycosyl hydrolase family 8 [Fibromonadales bacterium]
MIKSLKIFATLVLMFTASSFAQNLLYPSSLPRVSETYDSILVKTWEGVKKRNIDAYSTGLVHRPKSETPGDAVSEGVSYGMLLALYANDQEYFNKVWDAGERYMWNTGSSGGWMPSAGNYYDWRVNSTGSQKLGTGAASDADQDIALLLIFADQLVRVGIWKNGFTSMRNATYKQRATSILATVRGSMLDQGYLKPGNGWGGPSSLGGEINPGYFAPAFYRIFAEYEPQYASTWNTVIDKSYELIKKSPGYARGLLPDWCKSDGSSTNGAGYNAYRAGDALYRDAIRVYWRLGADYLWYKEPRAKEFLDNAMAFIESKGGPDAVNFYEMNGNLLPENDVERLNNKTITRSRREHSHLTAGMWAAAAIGTGNVELAEKYSAKLLEFYEGSYYWGKATDPTGGRFIGNGNTVDGAFGVNANVPEDTLRNETYFDQFLAWFGASMLGGAFTNVWEDLKNGIPVSIKPGPRNGNAHEYSIQRIGQNLQIVLSGDMAGANARLFDTKGKVIMHMKVSQSGLLNISSGDLAAGVYFIDIKKQGRTIFYFPIHARH